MTEKEKAKLGLLYDANYDEEILKERERINDLCFEYNSLKPSMHHQRKELIKTILKQTKENFTIMSPFYCDLGNMIIGENFYSNYNLVVLDGATVTFGDNVFIAPNCCFSTAGHPIDAKQRNQGLEFAYPITVGDNVWFGAHVTVLPGVKIGNNSVIGAGSVVTKDIPDNVIAVGNPCKVLRKINEEDKNKYKK
ncbi:MAG: sugar O-acetyltransferase [Erysipelotrichales bacterium]|nr:sugar O-acetyltransferase [Erysipelotrichales bacterium]